MASTPSPSTCDVQRRPDHQERGSDVLRVGLRQRHTVTPGGVDHRSGRLRHSVLPGPLERRRDVRRVRARRAGHQHHVVSGPTRVLLRRRIHSAATSGHPGATPRPRSTLNGSYNYFQSGDYFLDGIGDWNVKNAFVLFGYPGESGPEHPGIQSNDSFATNPCRDAWKNDPQTPLVPRLLRRQLAS